MSKKVKYLNLPKIPSKLESELIEFGLKIPFDEEISDSFDIFRDTGLEIVGFNSDKLPVDIEEELHKIYDIYFPDERIIFFIQRSTSKSGKVSTLPPHCDSYRNTAINYVLLDGGNDVKIKFYKQDRFDKINLESAELCLDKDLDLDCVIELEKNIWHSYDVQTYHSVEGIVENRLLINLVLTTTNPNIENFYSQYKNLLIET